MAAKIRRGGRPPGSVFSLIAAGFAAPLVAALLYVSPAATLIYDPATHAGVFRGGGQVGFDLARAWGSLVAVLRDLFIRGESYYFELSRPEFSGLVAAIGLAWVGLTVIYLGVRGRANRLALGAALLLLVLNLTAPNLSVNGLPGLRRCTGVITAYVIFFALAWRYHAAQPGTRPRLRRTGLVLCLLLPLSHALKLPSLLADAARASPYRAGDWFALRPTPTESLAYVTAQLDRGQILEFVGPDGKVLPARYQEVYAAVSGARLWNGHRNPPVYALDWRNGRKVALTPELWASYYFPH